MTREELKQTRLRLGLSQAGIAELLDVAPGTVARWERGELQIEHPSWLDAKMREIETTLYRKETDNGKR